MPKPTASEVGALLWHVARWGVPFGLGIELQDAVGDVLSKIAPEEYYEANCYPYLNRPKAPTFQDPASLDERIEAAR